MKYYIFDFNGTVVDDLDLSVECINHTIEKYLDRKPLTRDDYRNVFRFPVKAYYEDVGFDFNKLNWEEVGTYWMDYYQSRREEPNLHKGVKEFMIKNHELGNKNILLSASSMDNLISHTKALGIYDLLDEILGLDNIYATSKIPLGVNFVKDKNKEDCIMLGDTEHDLEVANAMGVKCILIANGHESKERLLKVHKDVVDRIEEVELCV